jgi:hypothetical protein
MGAPDFYNMIAHERGKPEAWRWYSLRAVGEDRESGAALVEGGIPTRTISRGPNKGHPDWRKLTDRAELLITFADYEARKARWETETGLCNACGGDGQIVRRVSREHGREMTTCHRCKGDGKARSAP